MNGLLLVDKPTGPTSFDVVRAVKRAVGTRKVGHTGTLDPLASGLLVVCINEGTKLVQYLMDGTKRYLAQITLGFETNTDDCEGEKTKELPVPNINNEMLEATIKSFVGEIDQIPPAYSAIKQGGEPLYRKARRGEQVVVDPRKVMIHSIDLLDFKDQIIELDVCCGKGTYIRALARDLARALGTAGHLTALRRTQTSGFELANSISLADLDCDNASYKVAKKIVAPNEALENWPRIRLNQQQEEALRQGKFIISKEVLDASSLPDECQIMILGPDNQMIAIGKIDKDLIKPVRIIHR